MFDSKFQPDLQKQEQGKFDPSPLNTVQLSEIPIHEGVRQEIKVEIAKKIVRLEMLEKGSPPKFQNEKKILLSGLQNLVIQERLSQVDGPVSLSKKDFKGFIAKQDQALADKYFSDEIWGGISTATRAIELDLEAEDNLADKQVIFCDLLDANDATDYILVGRNTDSEDPRFTFKLVQAGTLEGDKSQSDIKDQHLSLARRLSNDKSPEKVFEQNEDEIIGLMKEILQKLPDDISLGSVVDILLEKHFDISEIDKSKDEINIMQDLPARDRQNLIDDLEKFIYFAQQDSSPESRQALIKDVADDEGLDESSVEEFVLLIIDTFNSPKLLKSASVDFISRTMIRFDNDNKITEKDAPLDIDSNIVPMYYVDELEISNLLENHIYGKSKKDKDDAA